jgi:hypothetical protein
MIAHSLSQAGMYIAITSTNLSETYKVIGKGMGLFNSGVIKTKLLTLPLLWAYWSTIKYTLRHVGDGFTTNSRESNFTSQELPGN